MQSICVRYSPLLHWGPHIYLNVKCIFDQRSTPCVSIPHANNDIINFANVLFTAPSIPYAHFQSAALHKQRYRTSSILGLVQVNGLLQVEMYAIEGLGNAQAAAEETPWEACYTLWGLLHTLWGLLHTVRLPTHCEALHTVSPTQVGVSTLGLDGSPL